MTVTETVVELRRYRLHAGRRDELIELFERELVEPQEAVGMRLIGQFTDQDEPDQFVWLRGFADMGARDRALRSFYGGPVWAEHRDAANATMLDSDDVLLLRPIPAARSFASVGTSRPSPGARPAERGVLVTTVLLSQAVPEPLVETLADELSVALGGVGGRLQGLLVSEHSPNTFTALPVREGENAVVWIADPHERPGHARARGPPAPDRTLPASGCLRSRRPLAAGRIGTSTASSSRGGAIGRSATG
jgi:hypothetical protein